MFNTVPQMLFEKAKNIPTASVQYAKNKAGTFEPVSYIDFAQQMFYFASGLITLGNGKNDHVGLISDNRKEWLVCSMGIMALGCADIPRGSEATVKDLSYILSFSESKTVIVENNYSFKKIIECRGDLKTLQNIVVIDPTGVDKTLIDVPVYTYDEVIEAGKKYRTENPGKIEEILNSGKEDDIATIIFTSGTTGVPKGVELTHKNFLCQIKALTEILPLKPGDKSLSVLPIWHVYEREMEYYLLANGCSLCYSKPVISMILADFQKIQPQFMACVPRIWDGIYTQIEKKAVNKSKSRKILFKLCTGAAKGRLRIRAVIYGRNARYRKDFWLFKILNKVLYIPLVFLLPLVYVGELVFFKKARDVFGGCFKIAVSGGGGIAPKLDRFYNAIGLRLVEGYGLTETAPMVTLRSYRRPVLGTIGRPLDYCEIKIVNRHGVDCAPGQLGVLYVRGPNVMKGYYNQPELTEEVLQDGWFNTGDLVVRTVTGEISIKGRAKDTIVLRSGENVEPLPIENKLVESPYIAQAVVVGQDQNCLGALIIPNKDNLKKYAEENNLAAEPFSALLKSDEVYDLIFKELERLVTPKTGFKPFEKIGKFAFIEKPFEIGIELTAKGTVQRFKVQELYKWQIASMFSESVFAQGLSSFTGNLKDLGNKTSGLLHKR
ncbi:MAG: AMP-binding protein [Treponema sp.]|nr:AMP-binding protein [Treponema sp.]